MLPAVCHLRSSQKNTKNLRTETASPSLAYAHGDKGYRNPSPGDVAETVARSMDMRTQRQHSIYMWCGGVTKDRLRHKQPAAACRGHAMHTYMVLPTAAVVRQGCSVVLSACCLLSVINDLHEKKKKKNARGKNCLSTLM